MKKHEPCSPGCPGWFPAMSDRPIDDWPDGMSEVQRCDDCDVYPDDFDAALAASPDAVAVYPDGTAVPVEKVEWTGNTPVLVAAVPDAVAEAWTK